MERRERISRRSALIAIAGLSAAGAGLALEHRVFPYIKYLSSRKHEAPQDGERIEEFIHTFHENSSVKANKTTFAEELKFIAKKENPSRGPSWLYSFLKVFPLEIQFPQEDAKPLVSKNGVVHQPRAGYTPALWGMRPAFIFYPSFLQEYLRAKHEVDVVGQVRNDMVVWHEIIHLWQDVRNPIRQIITTDVHESFEKVNHNKFIQPYDIRTDPSEVEAWEKASEIVEARFNSAEETGDLKNWSFANFFSSS